MLLQELSALLDKTKLHSRSPEKGRRIYESVGLDWNPSPYLQACHNAHKEKLSSANYIIILLT